MAALVLHAGDGAAESAALTLAQPQPYQVVQRDAGDRGRVPVKGICSGPATRVEARYEKLGAGATTSAWTRVASNLVNGAVEGGLSVPAGGWYRLTVRALDGEREVARQVVEKVGVGEVFIVAGQSNSGNFGWPRQTPTEDRAAAYCPWCKAWRHGHDPQPSGGGGSGGSPWPAMESALVRALDVPVTVVCLAVGGASVSNWLPATRAGYGGIPRALDFAGPQGARAILWHQGETDAASGTTTETYAERLETIIAQSRRDAGWAIPWGVATAAFYPEPPNETPEQRTNRLDRQAAIRAGQARVQGLPGVFAGAYTDDLTGPEWRCDTIHFNARGFDEHGKRWAERILASLFPEVPTQTVRQAEAALALVSPAPGKVVQRDAQNQGEVPVSGNYAGSLSRIEARWTPMTGGEPSPWNLVDDHPAHGYFTGALRLPAGWHRLDVRGLHEGTVVVARSVSGVGVGEVFVAIGGESVANFGQTRQAAGDPRVSGYCSLCFERPLADPVRGAVGDRGTSWPVLGDELAATLDLPVKIVVSGYSGTSAQWMPKTTLFNGGILSALYHGRRFAKGGYRAILWEVGELDAKQGVSQADYVGAFTAIVAQVRQTVGWAAPWVVAGTAYHPEAPATNQLAIRAAQRQVCDGPRVLEGPTADDLTGPHWRFDGLHFTEAGQREHGRRWANRLRSLFFE